nr:MAG TPA: hypothetical protein [Caudoviricetes sp.]
MLHISKQMKIKKKPGNGFMLPLMIVVSFCELLKKSKIAFQVSFPYVSFITIK